MSFQIVHTGKRIFMADVAFSISVQVPESVRRSIGFLFVVLVVIVLARQSIQL